jgi:serine/threonine protein kinase
MTSSKTQPGTVLSTPSYMSPEQIAGKKVNGRSDIFSLSAVFYKLLTGEKPFTGDSFATLMHNITSSAPPPVKGLFPNIPDKLVQDVEKLLAKDAEARYQTGRELMDALIASLN